MNKGKTIPLSVPNISGNELKYVTEAVKSQWVSTAGASVSALEKEAATKMGVPEACACQSGTAGLHLCLRHFGIGREDIVLVPTLTFIAPVNTVLYQGAVPVFFDCDDHLCINPQQVEEYLAVYCKRQGDVTVEKASGRRVKAIIPVHVFGDFCDMDSIMRLAEQYHLIVIEDATESLGSVYTQGKYAGCMTGTIGDAGVYSFNGNKIITTGGGGMVVSKDAAAVEHIRYLSQQAKNDTLYFVHDEYGYNYRMTNVQAALGLGQWERLDEFIQRKQDNFKLYQERLAKNRIGSLMEFSNWGQSNHWFYSFVLNQPDAALRDRLLQELQQDGIQTRPIWKLNHLQKPFREFYAMDTTRAEAAYDSIINIPCSTNLSEEEIDIVCEKLNSY